jgi:hypothetical protein
MMFDSLNLFRAFETAKDIIEILRAQFAYLFRDGLILRQRLNLNGLSADFLTLRGTTFRVAVERPEGWEYLLFAHVLNDEVVTSQDLRRAHKLGLAFGLGETVDLSNFPRWVQIRMDELQRMVGHVSDLVNNYLQKALGPPGEAGNPSEIIFAARQIGEFYRHLMAWSRQVRCVHVDKACRPVIESLSCFTDDIIDELEGYGPVAVARIREALEMRDAGKPQNLNLSLTFTLSKADEFGVNVERAMRDLGL